MIKNNIKNYYDISLFGKRTNTGSIEELWDEEALANSVVLWLSSNRGDYIRKPWKGGYVLPHLTKPMSEEIRRDLANAIIQGLQEDYDKIIKVESIAIQADYINKTWTITINAYSLDIKKIFEISTILKNLI